MCWAIEADVTRSEQRREEEAFGRPDDIPPAVPLMTDKGARRQSVFTPADTVRIAVSLDAMGPARHAVILKDLFWTLYSKLAAVLEGHRVIYEVARWIPSVCPVYASELTVSGEMSRTILVKRAIRHPLSLFLRFGNPSSRKCEICSTCIWPMTAKALSWNAIKYSRSMRSCEMARQQGIDRGYVLLSSIH